MKKLLFAVLLLAVAAGTGYLMHEGVVPGWQSDRALIKSKSLRFLECLKFKAFEEAAAFHAPADRQARPDLPKLLEDFFKIPPENLDIQDLNVDFIEFDSTGQRAKAKTTCGVRILNTKEEKRPEAVLYWKKADGTWYLDLRTTLERGSSAGF
ncbi:MAG: hypothetical protein PHU21_13490 [Elusimicrobia bacterium]|nr:hypothetical protein [Elusimicrobiota bacterium]